MAQEFFTGDVVRYVGRAGWKKGAEHIIHQTDYRGNGRFKYSTNKGAWFEAKEFELISRADARSFNKLDADLSEEGEF